MSKRNDKATDSKTDAKGGEDGRTTNAEHKNLKSSKKRETDLDGVSFVEREHRGNAAATRVKLALSKLGPDPKIQTPAVTRSNRSVVIPGTVGLRQAVTAERDEKAKSERDRTLDQHLRANRRTKRHAMWDKLDLARKNAMKRMQRYRAFEPQRGPKPS